MRMAAYIVEIIALMAVAIALYRYMRLRDEQLDRIEEKLDRICEQGDRCGFELVGDEGEAEARDGDGPV